MGEGRREVIYWLIKGCSKSKPEEGWWEMVYFLVEAPPESEVEEGVRQEIH